MPVKLKKELIFFYRSPRIPCSKKEIGFARVLYERRIFDRGVVMLIAQSCHPYPVFIEAIAAHQ
jgi:hypothetical protein